jgi:hypothetical protein
LSNMYKDTDMLKTACGSPCYAAPEMLCIIWFYIDGKPYGG